MLLTFDSRIESFRSVLLLSSTLIPRFITAEEYPLPIFRKQDQNITINYLHLVRNLNKFQKNRLGPQNVNFK